MLHLGTLPTEIHPMCSQWPPHCPQRSDILALRRLTSSTLRSRGSVLESTRRIIQNRRSHPRLHLCAGLYSRAVIYTQLDKRRMSSIGSYTEPPMYSSVSYDEQPTSIYLHILFLADKMILRISHSFNFKFEKEKYIKLLQLNIIFFFFFL